MPASAVPAKRRPAMNRLHRLGELLAVFGKLGTLGFGGPAPLIAMTEDEVVARRGWLSRERFLDLVGATNLIPGPNAAEIAMHVGYLRAGWAGLLTAGAALIVPAALITAVFAWAYVAYGALPQVAPFLYGAKPAVLAVIVAAIGRLGRTAAQGWRLVAVGAAVTAASLCGVNEIAALFAGGLVGMCWLRLAGRSAGPAAAAAGAAVALGSKDAWAGAAATAAAVTGAAALSLTALGLFFLKVGATLYGSGYVLVAFLQGGLVHEHGWLTQQQLLDAVAIGQFTPGPLLTTATFIGYVLLGLPGAIIATAAIFLPSFVFVAALGPVLPRLRRSAWAGAFLDAVNICSVGLMAAVAAKLAGATLGSWPAWAIAIGAAILGLRWKVNAAWLVLGGAGLGWLLSPWANL